MKLEIKIMLKILFMIFFVGIVMGVISPFLISAADDFMVLGGFALLGLSFIGSYCMIRYWIYNDVQKIIKSKGSTNEKI